MNIEIDAARASLIEQAVAQGRAADARSFVESLIESDAAEHQQALEALLLERLDEPAFEYDAGDVDALRARIKAIVEDRKLRRGA